LPSIGISYARLAPDGSASTITADQVLQDADTAMYRAKGRGKNRVEVFHDGLRNDLPESDRVEPVLR
jgi:diguanylate cyclase